MKRSAVPAVWLAAMLVCAWWALFKTPISSDITLFIPKTDTTAGLLLEQLHRGTAARIILMGIEGGTEQARAETSKHLASRLRASGLFARVANGEDLLDRDEQRKLFSYRYLLSPKVSPDRFSAAGLRAALLQRLHELGSPLSTFEKRLLPQDPTAEMWTLIKIWQGSGQYPEQRRGVWFTRDGRRALLLAETRSSGFDIGAQERVIGAIEKAFAASKERAGAGADITLLLSGPGVFAVSSQHTIRHEAESLSIAAGLLVVLIVVVVFRSLRPVLISMVLLGSTILGAVVTAGAVFGKVYGITLAFGMTLVGEVVDYPILVFAHLSRNEAPVVGLTRIWPTLRLCAATTMLGCLAMTATDLPGLAQLGLFTMVGLLSAAVFTRWVLPPLLPAVWTPRHDLVRAEWMTRLLHPGRLLAIGVSVLSVLALSALIALAPPLWEDDLAALSPIPQDILKLDQELRASFGHPEPGRMIVVIAPDIESALRRSEAVAGYLRDRVADGMLRGFDLAARYLPSQRTQRQRRAALPDPERLRANLEAALAGLPFRPGRFEPFEQAVAAARTGPLLSPSDLAGTALGLRVASLLLRADRGWTALILLDGVRDPDGLARGLGRQAYEGAYYLDMKAETNRLVARFRHTALNRLMWGAALIVAVVWLGFGRSARLVLAALLPVFLAIILDVAVLAALGKRLSLFHLVSLLLVLGIGTNYGLFFSRPDPDPADRKRTLGALLACLSSTLGVFGMLSLSKVPVLSAIGQTVAIGVFMSFVMALILAQHISKGGLSPKTVRAPPQQNGGRSHKAPDLTDAYQPAANICLYDGQRARPRGGCLTGRSSTR